MADPSLEDRFYWSSVYAWTTYDGDTDTSTWVAYCCYCVVHVRADDVERVVVAIPLTPLAQFKAIGATVEEACQGLESKMRSDETLGVAEGFVATLPLVTYEQGELSRMHGLPIVDDLIPRLQAAWPDTTILVMPEQGNGD